MFPFRKILAAIPSGDTPPGFLQYCEMISALAQGARIDFVQVRTDGVAADPPDLLPESRRHFLQGPVLDSLLTFATARSADVILTSQTKAGSRRTMARRLAMKAACGVWMVPGSAPARLNRVIAGIDFSPGSLVALETARALSPGSCTVLHVSEDRPSRQLAELAETAGASSIRWESGDIAGKINEVARSESADLIVMGDRGATQAGAILLGGEAERILLSSETPVLIVKHRPRGLSFLNALLEGHTESRQPISSAF